MNLGKRNRGERDYRIFIMIPYIYILVYGLQGLLLHDRIEAHRVGSDIKLPGFKSQLYSELLVRP